jgi:hypothetical protein
MPEAREQGPIIVQALYAEPEPTVDRERLAAELARLLGRVDDVGGDDPSSLLFSLPDLPVGATVSETPGGDDSPIPCTMSYAPVGPKRELLDHALEQTWTWPDAAAAVEQAAAGWVATAMLSWAWLDRATRLRLVHAGVEALVAASGPIALHWPGSQRLVDPAVYLGARESGEDALYPLANVRMYRISGADRDRILMDTAGLSALGLPDVQILYGDLEPSVVAARLHDLATYLYDEGDVIGDGDTVEGVDGQPWACTRERAAIGPDREVLVLDPQ